VKGKADIPVVFRTDFERKPTKTGMCPFNWSQFRTIQNAGSVLIYDLIEVTCAQSSKRASPAG